MPQVMTAVRAAVATAAEAEKQTEQQHYCPSWIIMLQRGLLLLLLRYCCSLLGLGCCRSCLPLLLLMLLLLLILLLLMLLRMDLIYV